MLVIFILECVARMTEVEKKTLSNVFSSSIYGFVLF